mmetsp:Transcript_57614/g.153924  ORF Transcript_57614/g.153924 Transcript_57614/m.153924 type:complete len:301 (-) Transcript_57614:390-1292(-)
MNSSAEQYREYVLAVQLGDFLQAKCLEKAISRLGYVRGMNGIVVGVLRVVRVPNLFDELLPALSVRNNSVNQVMAVHQRGDQRRQRVATGCGIKLSHIVVPLPGFLPVKHGQRLRRDSPQILHRQHRWSALLLSLRRSLLLLLLRLALGRGSVVDPCVRFLVQSTASALLCHGLVQITRRNYSTSKLQVTSRLAVQNSRSLKTLERVQNPVSRHGNVATAAALQATGGGLGLAHLAENDNKTQQAQNPTQAQDLVQHFVVRHELQDGQPHGDYNNEAVEHIPGVADVRLPESDGLQEDLN